MAEGASTDRVQSFGDRDDHSVQREVDEVEEIGNSTAGISLRPADPGETVQNDAATERVIVEDTPTISIDESEAKLITKEASPAIPTDATSPNQQVTSPATPKPPTPDLSIVRLIHKADHSAGKLVNLLAKHFPSFRDEARFDGKRVRFLKRAQIFVADLWAAFNGTGYGEFSDINALTMFAGECGLSDDSSSVQSAWTNLLIAAFFCLGQTTAFLKCSAR